MDSEEAVLACLKIHFGMIHLKAHVQKQKLKKLGPEFKDTKLGGGYNILNVKSSQHRKCRNLHRNPYWHFSVNFAMIKSRANFY